MAGGPREVQAACGDAVAALAGAFVESAVTGSREQWSAAVGSLQRVVDVASAAQDAAIARLAAVEAELLEDGTVVESHRPLGHVALDAPAIVSGVLAVSAVHAERRVRAAVRLAADGPAGTDTGLGGLHEAMRSGRLDAYRAGVVAEELEEAPAPVRATVVAALEPHLAAEDGAHLRRRCRRALARISPDLLVQRARRARDESGLRRWVDEPGVDRWEGTFPSEEAARAWAAIDALARRYVAEQVCPTIERARAKALTDLVAGNATVDTVLTLTVPAAVVQEPAPPSTRLADHSPSAATVPEPGPTPTPETEARARAGADSDRQPATEPEVRAEPHASPPGVRDGDLVEVTGLHGSQPVLVSRQWLALTVEDQHARNDGRVPMASCHPETGAALDLDPVAGMPGAASAAVGEGRYRPSARLAKRARARDRRCRFPGCAVAAVFCDLDHVRPWPAGPTSLANLMCLCRRHHRVKQRPGWRVVLATDGVATWTDPTGRVRTTEPVDALHAIVLLGAARPTGVALRDGSGTPTAAGPNVSEGVGTGSRPRTVVPDGPHGELEFLLEHLGAGRREPTAPAWRDQRGRHRVDLVPPHRAIRVAERQPADRHRPAGRRGHQGRLAEHDLPPF